MAAWQLQDAKAQFSAVVDAAIAGEPQEVTRRGKPAVMIVAVDEYERLRLTDEAAKPDFIQHLLAIPKGGPEDLFESSTIRLREIEF